MGHQVNTVIGLSLVQLGPGKGGGSGKNVQRDDGFPVDFTFGQGILPLGKERDAQTALVDWTLAGTEGLVAGGQLGGRSTVVTDEENQGVFIQIFFYDLEYISTAQKSCLYL